MSYELSIEDIKKAKITLTLVGINIILYIVLNVALDGKYVFELAQYNYVVKNNGEWYRFFTAMFMHGGLNHLLNNMIMLLVVGAFCETFFPNKKIFLLTYIVSGLIGNIFTLLIMSEHTVSLGASGAIAGLVGATLFFRDYRERLVKTLVIVFMISFIYNSFMPGIGTWAHIFGLFSGILIGYLLTRKEKKKWKR